MKKVQRLRRDIRISISRKNTDMFGMCQTLKVKGYSPSNFICIATREKFLRDVKIIPAKAVLLPPQQQEPREVITYKPREKTEDEIQREKQREADQARLKEARDRYKRMEYESAKAFRES